MTRPREKASTGLGVVPPCPSTPESAPLVVPPAVTDEDLLAMLREAHLPRTLDDYRKRQRHNRGRLPVAAREELADLALALVSATGNPPPRAVGIARQVRP